VDSNRIARVTLPFFGCMLVAIALVTVFPQIATGLPNALMGVPK
jgi:TRAP-type C4-dicarboxylate transport system permease large subunit